MPLASYFPRQKAVRTSAGILLGRGRGSLVGGSGSLQPEKVETVASSIGCPPAANSVMGTFCHMFSGHSVAGPSCRTCAPFERNVVLGSNSLSGGAESGVHQVKSLSWKRGLDTAVAADIHSQRIAVDGCKRLNVGLKNRQPCGGNMIQKCFAFGMFGGRWKSELFMRPPMKGFQLSISAPFSARTASDVSFDGVPREEQLENPDPSTTQKLPGDRTLKLLSGSCYLPHPDKEETGGEDAHFICVDEQAIGVADGVGGWADLGVDSGQYARELMLHSESAVQEEPKGSIDPARVLEKAYRSTKAKGSSTACIIALTEKGIHAVNLGDSGFIVVRDGCTIFRSPVQQHDFNFTYQLECGNGSDLPSSAQVFTVPVAAGDVVVAGTDGLFDNLYNNEVNAVVIHGVRAGLAPQVTAQKVAALARQRAQDKNRQTPFSTAAQDAGFRYYGGKLDDITVVVSYVTASST